MTPTRRPPTPAARTSLRTAGSWPRHEPRIVVFDLGEVLATPLDRGPEAVGAAYWSHRDAYDRVGSAQAFWSRVLGDLGLPPRHRAPSPY